MANLYEQIYGRPAQQWELEQTAGMDEQQLRSVLEASLADWNSKPTKKDSSFDEDVSWIISNNTGYLTNPDSNFFVTGGTSSPLISQIGGFVTGGTRPPATTQAQSISFTPAFPTGAGNTQEQFATPQYVQALMPQPISMSGKPNIFDPAPMTVGVQGIGAKGSGDGFYASNLIKALRDASAGQPITTTPGVNFMPNQVTPQSAANFGTGLPPTGLSNAVAHTTPAEYDPNALYREIYGRDASPSELANTRGMRETDVRNILTNSLAEWQAAQNQTNPWGNFAWNAD